ncbi:MAG: hypothetical protein AB4042_05140, partial [Leptolyngbyaceae cyanobacterium]
GGRLRSPRPATPLISRLGYPALWQARMQQFAEQLVESGALESREALVTLLPDFQFLPPVGLLPKTALDIILGRPDADDNAGDGESGDDSEDNDTTEPPTQITQYFFPDNYDVRVAPVPVEQLDEVMQMSASLAPYNRQVSDQVTILVPVPQVVYEPNLLQTEAVDGEFEQRIVEFEQRRDDWLERRTYVREIATLLVTAIKGEPPTYQDPNPKAEVFVVPDDPEEATYETTADNDGKPTGVGRIEQLRDELQEQTPLRSESRITLEGQLPEDFEFPANLQGKIRYEAGDGNSSSQLIFQGRMTESERGQIINVLRTSTSLDGQTRVATVRALYRISQADDLSWLSELGLEKFIEFLDDKVQRANDKIDLGFVRAQTDIYRLRQIMLGNVEASRLATSPALAEIAKGETAVATRSDLENFLAATRDKPVIRDDDGQPVRGPGTPPIFIANAELAVSSAEIARVPSRDTQLLSPSVSVRLPGDLVSGSPPPLRVEFQPQPTLDQILEISPQPSRGFDQVDQGRQPLDFGLDRVTEAIAITPSATLQPLSTVRDLTNVFQFPTQDKILEQAPIIGKDYTFRTTTVSERLKTSPALESKAFAVANKYSVVNDALRLDINIDDLAIPGFHPEALEIPDFSLEPDENRESVRISLPFKIIRENNIAIQILEERHDPDPSDGDEATFFGVGTQALDDAIATLRILEGRVQGYRVAIDLCRKALRDLTQTVQQVDQRLKVIGDELAEARHDVAVGQVLLEEEQQRIAALNQKRQMIWETQVKFLAFYRPRTLDLLAPVATQGLIPGGIAAAVPACLQDDEEVLPELQDAVDLLRESPVKWFPAALEGLANLNRREVLLVALKTAAIRAKTLPTEATRIEQLGNQGQIGATIYRTVKVQQKVLQPYRLQTAELEVGRLRGRSWKELRDRAQDLLSLGDLIDGSHKRSKVSKQVSEELENIAQVAMCLYTRFGEVLPEIRVEWVERLSQFDQPVNLRRLASLPSWGEVDQRDRREMQVLVDWLYDRIDPQSIDAQGLISDLVRIALLLASYAPVDEMIVGQVAEEKSVKPGGLINLTINRDKVRIGMRIRTTFQGKTVEGVVDDLLDNRAVATITKIPPNRQSVTLTKDTTVQFIEPRRFKQPRFSKRARS